VPDKALVLARLAVKRDPSSGSYRNTLGVAHYRLGQWRDAAAVLERNPDSHYSFVAWDHYFLAMSHRHLGHGARAGEHFEQAVRWHGENEGPLSEAQRAELSAIRAEAQAVLNGPRSPGPSR
jgi:hypothetical protein